MYTEYLGLGAEGTSSIGKETYTVNVNYRLGINEAITEGDYDLVDNEITRINPRPLVRGRHKQVFCLIHINKKLVDRNELFVEINRYRSFVFATTRELLAFGAAYPRIQLRFPVATPGVSMPIKEKREIVPVLCGNRVIGTRYAWLQDIDQLDPATRFLVLRL